MGSRSKLFSSIQLYCELRTDESGIRRAASHVHLATTTVIPKQSPDVTDLGRPQPMFDLMIQPRGGLGACNITPAGTFLVGPTDGRWSWFVLLCEAELFTLNARLLGSYLVWR